jgi:hypothetical protein
MLRETQIAAGLPKIAEGLLTEAERGSVGRPSPSESEDLFGKVS